MEEGGGRLLPGAAGVTFLVCEDGTEYTDRFRRFLGGQFQFLRAGHFAEALALAAGASAVLLDLDFRRTQPALLVDERGAPAPRSAADVQGILILRGLRADRFEGTTLPVPGLRAGETLHDAFTGQQRAAGPDGFAVDQLFSVLPVALLTSRRS